MCANCFAETPTFAISTRRESSRRTINPFVRVPLLLQLRLHVGRVTAANVLCDDRLRVVHGQRHVEWVRTA
jgi:hypothetical protein